MASSTQDQKSTARLEQRQRLRDDYAYYGPRCLTIRNKHEQLVPLEFNTAQSILHAAAEKQLDDQGYIRIIVLKGRQQGASTYIGGRMYFTVSQRKASKAMVIAHKSTATSTLFDMTKRFHSNAPVAVRPHTSYSSKKELAFDKLDSSFVLATAGGDDIGRSETISQLHASEVGFWPAGVARDNWNGVTKCVPLSKGTSIWVESTANGVGDLFHDLWLGAVAGENGFLPIFIPWYIQQEYAAPAPDGFDLTPDEDKLVSLYGLTNNQLWWRRMEVSKTSLELFQQEYPCTADEAFQTSGRPVFDSRKVAELLNVSPAPLRRLALEGVKPEKDDAFDERLWEENVRGELFIYENVDPEESYYIGADVGGGVKGDPSVAQVLNSKRRQVAVWEGQILPDAYAGILAKLGERYNYALIGVEANNHGILPLHILSKIKNYPHVYQDTIYDTINETETKRIGFTTSSKSKPMIIDAFRGSMRDDRTTPVHAKTLREMSTFVVNPAGRMEAQAGCHDDHVMSYAIALHVSDQSTSTVITSDEHYVEAL